jgi:hypothetical protein
MRQVQLGKNTVVMQERDSGRAVTFMAAMVSSKITTIQPMKSQTFKHSVVVHGKKKRH